ncbi:hypothetical protein PDESU_00736 [Pontiella desulfatans]|uniref:Wzt C-terminal domain-containing protein n=1 Tax=Pontiella desulfatans TaxID=2750659 RepID=A0A6C2TWX3_PONDE|nr:hypothetical protein [Pontiella desulfatans]VGO12185.1 hypothetical protein PDESU_00736 [Pontiella desulfatans]
MKIEVFALCDAATDNHGKLNILGTFDQIYSAKVPVVHPACAIAMRLRFDKMEEGVHKVNLQLVNPDGIPVFQPMEGEVHPRMGADVGSVAVNLILNFQHVKFDEYADYQINLAIDDVALAALPLRVRQMPSPRPA